MHALAPALYTRCLAGRLWQLTYYDQGKAKWHYRVDYEAQERIRRQQRRSALPDLVRACWPKNSQSPLIVDCCAGFGHDSVLLSLYGAQVIAFEQNPLIACLGQSALQHASLACPPQLQWGDGLKQVFVLKPSCIYLDPCLMLHSYAHRHLKHKYTAYCTIHHQIMTSISILTSYKH